MPPKIVIRLAVPSAGLTVAGLVATAFNPLDVSQWLVPDPQERYDIFPHYFGIVVDHALECGTVHVTNDLTGAAVWLPVPHPEIPGYDDKIEAACGEWADRFRQLDAAMHKAHPTKADHDYLAFLAVHPTRQGHRYGTALLRHHLDHLDEAGRPAYLEASNSRSRDLYERLGWSDCAPTLDLPYQGERMYPMWRGRNPPNPATS